MDLHGLLRAPWLALECIDLHGLRAGSGGIKGGIKIGIKSGINCGSLLSQASAGLAYQWILGKLLGTLGRLLGDPWGVPTRKRFKRCKLQPSEHAWAQAPQLQACQLEHATFSMPASSMPSTKASQMYYTSTWGAQSNCITVLLQAFWQRARVTVLI